MTASRPLNLLVVDDDDLDVENVRRALKKGGIEDPVYVARDGADALDKLRRGAIPWDRLVILLDLNMPGMSGLEFLEELRGDKKLAHLPVVVLTTSNQEADRLAAHSKNVAGYLLKPIHFPHFVDLMTAMHRYWGMVQFAPARS